MDKGKSSYQPPYDAVSPIKNPAMGWMLYIDAFHHIDASHHAAGNSAPLDSGFPDAGAYWAAQDHSGASELANIQYIRVPWAQLEPAKGHYAWEQDANFIDLIEGARKRHLRLAFRVYVDSRDSYRQATPEFVRSAGAGGYEEIWEDAHGHSHLHWNPAVTDRIFQWHFEDFIQSFAARFDDPREVDFIDGQGLGWWGEMHHIRVETDEELQSVFRWITATYATSFKRVLLGAQIGAIPDALTDWAVHQMGYVLRRDSFGSPRWLTPRDKENILTHWPQTAVFAENCYHHLISRASWWKEDGFLTLRDVLWRVVSDALQLHANTLDLRGPEDSAAWMLHAGDLVEHFFLSCGYRFHLSAIRFESVCKRDRTLRIRHSWINHGAGKLPNDTPNWNHKYRITFALLHAQSDTCTGKFVVTDVDPADWIGNQENSYSTETFWHETKEGIYRLGVAIMDSSHDSTPPIALATILPQTETGWYIIGTVQFTGSPKGATL